MAFGNLFMWQKSLLETLLWQSQWLSKSFSTQRMEKPAASGKIRRISKSGSINSMNLKGFFGEKSAISRETVLLLVHCTPDASYMLLYFLKVCYAVAPYNSDMRPNRFSNVASTRATYFDTSVFLFPEGSSNNAFKDQSNASYHRQRRYSQST